MVWTKADMCAFDKMVEDPQGRWKHILEPTRFMTNSVCVAKNINKTCPNKETPGTHEHIIVEGGERTKRSAIYSKQLCDQICKGIIEQRRADEEGICMIAEISARPDKEEDAKPQEVGRSRRKES